MPELETEQPGTSDPRPESIESLFTALESPLLCYALRLLRDRQLAEDVVQEAFMRLQSQFDAVKEPRRWLYRTVHNLALNHCRDSAKIVPLNPPAPQEDSPTPETPDPQPLPDEQIARL